MSEVHRQGQWDGGQGNIILATNMEQGNAIVCSYDGDRLMLETWMQPIFFSKVGQPVL
jgi:hypothetical protein